MYCLDSKYGGSLLTYGFRFGKRKKGLSISEDRKTLKKVLTGDEDTGVFYWDDMEPVSQPVVKTQKIYPNAPCPCGSGKKYKKCCGNFQYKSGCLHSRGPK